LSCDGLTVKKKLTDFVKLKRVGAQQEYDQQQRSEDLIHARKVLVLRKDLGDVRQISISPCPFKAPVRTRSR
jgi:hypothetical protein